MIDTLKCRQAIILAGGAGSRLASRLNGLPKPLIDVDGIPLLGRQLQQLADAGFDEVIILANYRAEAIESYVGYNTPLGLRVHIVQDGEEARGTAGATFAVRHLLADTFLIVYGDTLFDIDLERFYAAHAEARKLGGTATLFLHPNDHPYDSDIVAVGADGFVTAFHPKPHPGGVWFNNLVNAALYIIDKQLIDSTYITDGIVDFGKDFFPAVISAGHKLAGYRSYEYIKDLGTPDRLDKVIRDLRSGKVERARMTSPQKAIFLDRDGTLNNLNGYISSADQLHLLSGVGEAVRAFNEAEYRCIVITNQPVIARGECSEDSLGQIHAKLETLLGEHRAYLDATYVCPHHPDAGFPGERRELKFSCNCRKPSPGMIIQAASDLSIDLSVSWMIGDTAADIGAARNAGVKNILLMDVEGKNSYRGDEPDFVFPDLMRAAHFILHQYDICRQQLMPLVLPYKAGTVVRIAGNDQLTTLSVACLFRQILAERRRDEKDFGRDRSDKTFGVTQPNMASFETAEKLAVKSSGWLNQPPIVSPPEEMSSEQGAEAMAQTAVPIPCYDIYFTDYSSFVAVPSSAQADILIFVENAHAGRIFSDIEHIQQRLSDANTVELSELMVQMAHQADLVITLPLEHVTK
ncbi:HAD-IIIA family hydrolase [Brucella sp. 21LCYQ03]|nr:HAD-IIIA family hydrolase [Brucella sp. 21LCYQ03]